MLSGGYPDYAVEKENRFLQNLVQSSLDHTGKSLGSCLSLLVCVLSVSSLSLVCVLSASYLSHVCFMSVSCLSLVRHLSVSLSVS